MNSFSPSQAFNSSSNIAIMLLFSFMHDTNSYLSLKFYPYYVYMQGKCVMSLDYARFRLLLPNRDAVDPNTLLHYTNFLDGLVGVAYYTMASLKFPNIHVVMIETGWPSMGNAMVDNSDT